MTEFTIEHNGVRLSCRRCGQGPYLIMIHGVACDGHYFDEAAGYLQDMFTVVTYDRRGYSESTAAEDADMSVEMQAEDLAAIVHALGTERAYICGSSAGGLIAVEFLRRYPEKVTAMMIHETPVGITEAYQKWLDDWLSDMESAVGEKKVLRAMITFIHELGGVDKEAPFNERWGQALENLKVFLYREMENFLHYGNRLPKESPDHSSVPVTVAAGREDIEGICSKYGKEVAAYLQADFMRVPGYHNLPYDRAEVFAKIVKEAFCER